MSTRVRRARNSLNVDVILDAAERVVRGGIDGFTIRAVAAEVDAAPMALYRHFPNKDALLDALLDRLLSAVPEPPATPDWREDLRGFAFAHALVLVDNPWAVPSLSMHPEPGRAPVRIGEAAQRVLARGGITGADAVAAFSAILAINYGWAALGRYAGQSNYERALELVIAGIGTAAR